MKKKSLGDFGRCYAVNNDGRSISQLAHNVTSTLCACWERQHGNCSECKFSTLIFPCLNVSRGMVNAKAVA